LGGGGYGGPSTIVIEIGGRELFSLIQQEDGRYLKRNGRSAFGG
jgi:hypothetical protein